MPADHPQARILAGGTEVWRHDIEIPKKYGIDTNVGDTRGPSGIFRFLRTINPMLDIVRDIERYSPKAVLLNYTNPMAMLCGAIQRSSFIPTTGLCHSVQGTAQMLGWWIGAPLDEITYTCAGINHQAWYLSFQRAGEDLYPRLRAAVERPEVYREEIVRNEWDLLVVSLDGPEEVHDACRRTDGAFQTMMHDGVSGTFHHATSNRPAFRAE